MHTRQTLGMLHAVRNRCHRNRGGIRGQNRIRLHDLLKTAHQLLLDLQIFNNRFDHQRGIHHRIKLVYWLQSR